MPVNVLNVQDTVETMNVTPSLGIWLIVFIHFTITRIQYFTRKEASNICIFFYNF